MKGKNWKTYLPGLVAVVVLVLGNLFHWTPDQMDQFKDWLLEAIPVAIGAVAFFHGVLKNHDKKESSK